MKNFAGRKLLLSVFLFLGSFLLTFSQRTGFDKDEFLSRRMVLMNNNDADMILLFGEPIPYPGNPFRQDNDFYYLTGIEEAGSVLMMIPGKKSSVLFQPVLSDREVYVSGPNLISGNVDPKEYGFSDIVSIEFLDDYIGRFTSGNEFPKVYVRTSPPDFVDGGRGETDRSYATAALLHYNEIIPPYISRVNKLKGKYPNFVIEDIVPEIDRLRVIKTEFEQDILKINGKLSAMGVKEAMRITNPGVYEYQIEAAAMGIVSDGGAIRAAYPPIVASGYNTCTLHYSKNDRQAEDGDLILMDFGACLDYLTVDISRTWPVNGKFSPAQKKVYKLLLEIQKACIESYKPGVKQKEVLDYVSNKVGKMNLDISGLENYISHSRRSPVVDGQLRVENIISGFGHFVGMAVHDVGSYGDEGLKPGMVFAIEPGLYDPSTGIGIRIEDTVLITEYGCEVLTSAVPKEIDEIEELMRK